MSQAEKKIETWDSIEGEAYMEDGHGPSWQSFIEHLEEDSLKDKDILDFGCNRGGFLRLLNEKKPFKTGLGIDIAEESVRDAQERSPAPHISYAHNDILKEKTAAFDVAFSHEVIYLLPDLKAHAAEIHKALKDGGVYYLAIGEYKENPLWSRWKDIVSEFSPVEPQTYSLQEIAACFQTNGFDVSVRRMICNDFLPYDALEDRYLKSPMELVEFMTRYMMLFRFTKKS